MNNRIIGIIGAALLIIGIFLPIISVSAGPMSIGFSCFFVISNAPISESWPLILLALCGVAGLILALTNNYKALLGPGVIALGLLIYGFIKMKSGMASMGGPGGPEAGGDAEAAQQMLSAVSIGMGVYVMALGAIGMIVAGIMKSPRALATLDMVERLLRTLRETEADLTLTMSLIRRAPANYRVALVEMRETFAHKIHAVRSR